MLLSISTVISVVLSAYTGSFPALFTVAPPNSEFTAKYNIQNVPKAPISQPVHGKQAPTDCRNRDFCSWTCTKCMKPSDVSVCGNNQWALTYDDGPSPFTAIALDTLKKLGGKGTFFVTGTSVRRYPEYLKRIYDEGHLVAMHSWSHSALTSLTNEEIVAEFEYTALAIENIIGVRPKYYRPPFGDYDDRVRGVLDAMGLIPVLWNYDTNDWSFRGDANTRIQIINGVKAAAQGGGRGYISLEHDIDEYPSSLIPEIAQIVHDSGRNMVSVADCTGISGYIDSNSPPPLVPPVEPPAVTKTKERPNETNVITVVITESKYTTSPTTSSRIALSSSLPPPNTNKAEKVETGFVLFLSSLLAYLL